MRKRVPRKQTQTGMVLVFLAVILITLTILGIATITISRMHEKSGQTYTAATRAFFVAQSAISRAVALIGAGTPCNSVGPTIGTASFNGGQYSVTSQVNAIGDMCQLSATSAIPSLASPEAQRTITENRLIALKFIAMGVGDGGKFYYFDGNTWTYYGQVDLHNVYGVACPSGTDCLAGGDSGTIFHFDGTAWSEILNIGAIHFYGVSCPLLGTCYIVGRSGNVYYYDGTTATLVADVGASDMKAISCLSSTNCWVVGDSQKIYHYDGITWSEFTDLGNINLQGIACPATGDCWAVGDSGEIDHYNGTNWAPFTNFGSSIYFKAISCISGSDCWAVGWEGSSMLFESNVHGVFYHYNGSTWSHHTDLVNAGTSLNGIACNSKGQCWAIGYEAKVYKYENNVWSETADLGTSTIRALALTDQ